MDPEFRKTSGGRGGVNPLIGSANLIFWMQNARKLNENTNNGMPIDPPWIRQSPVECKYCAVLVQTFGNV